MRISLQIRLASLFVLILSIPAVTQDAKPMVSNDSLTREQIEIYRAFLESYLKSNDTAVMNLANETEPFNFWPSKRTPECFQGIEFEDMKKAQSTIHFMDSRLLVSRRIVLVNSARWNDSLNDISSGLLTLSEISFDKSHRYAAMSFGFTCGMLCGNGRTIIFEKIEGKWQETQRRCPGWVS